MKKTINTLLLLLLFAAGKTAKAQNSPEGTSGIKFEKNLSWQQVLEKAKAEHKYIFVDCYATWCAPCKQMDEQVYPLKEAGDTYNKEFICIKVQMDKTATDNEQTQSWYGIANMLQRNYTVNAYPTFLFFDPDGKPVHKVSGSRNAKQFIQLADDAQKPDKQYYSILKSFTPGTIDTVEEKGLARAFSYSDKELAGKLAADYLSRLPKAQLQNRDNGLLMVQFQNDPKVLDIAINYITEHDKRNVLNFIQALSRQAKVMDIAVNYENDLSQTDFWQKGNLDFVSAMSRNPKIKAKAIEEISQLDQSQFSEEQNLKFIEHFTKEPKVQAIVKNYINQLPEDSLYSKKMLPFVASFTQTTKDRGFDLFYRHAEKVDAQLKMGYAANLVKRVVYQTELKPALDKGEETDTTPDFESITKTIAQKYNQTIADDIIISGKGDWYNYLVNTQKQAQYWPDLINSRIAQIERFRWDTIGRNAININNFCYSQIFLHSNDPKAAQDAANWMKEVVNRSPADFNYLDTYACMLYKAGENDEAIQTEKKAVKLAEEKKDKKNATLFQTTVAKMKAGEKIWEEKEYQ